ncbi:MAG: hypothetical protein LBE34_12400 [Flavobacteriaceae bacterium]|nr:hypothetical protein [Flavobacteriaceae bacterium]
MKKKLRILTLALVSILAISCSSNDSNSSNTTTPTNESSDLLLINNINEKSYKYVNAKEELEYERLFEYTYTPDYLIDTFSIKYLINVDPYENENLAPTEFIYDNSKQLIAIKQNGKNTNEFTYKDNLLVKSMSESHNNRTISSFTYNSKKQVISSSTTSTRIGEKESNPYVTKFNYTKDLITEIITDNNESISIQYDSNKNLFKDSFFNWQINSYEHFIEIVPIYKPQNNIIKYTDKYYEYNTLYEFDKAGYPIKEITTEKALQTGKIEKKTITSYTYKIVTVKK